MATKNDSEKDEWAELRELGWSFPDREKGRRPRPMLVADLVDPSDDAFVVSGILPIVQVDKVR